MKTTLNIPDDLVRDAKLKALREGSTLTDLLVQGLDLRLKKGRAIKPLPVSCAMGGVLPGIDWLSLKDESVEGEAYR